MNKKAIIIATVIIIALLTGVTIGYAVKSKTKNAQIYEKYNIVNTTKLKNETKNNLPMPAEIEITEE